MNSVVTGRHQSPSSGPARTRSSARSQPARASSVTTTETTISAIVPYGRRSGRIPGISSRRSGASRGRARLGGFGAPRSSLGARLRSRVPQYGHSVMYGDTSEPQLLQTTNRSGPLAMGSRFYAPAASLRRPPSGTRRRGHDLAHDLGEVAVGLVDDLLAMRAAAAIDEVAYRLELGRRSEVLR